MAIKRKIMKKISSKLRKQRKTKVRKSFKFTKSKRENEKRKYKTKRRYQKGGLENECGICLENGDKLHENGDIDHLITLNCGHKFHRSEIIKWCQTISYRLCSCPTCRRLLTTEDMEQYMPAFKKSSFNQNSQDIPTPAR